MLSRCESHDCHMTVAYNHMITCMCKMVCCATVQVMTTWATVCVQMFAEHYFCQYPIFWNCHKKCPVNICLHAV